MRASAGSRAAWAAAGVASAVALVSIWHGAAPTWRLLNDEHREYASYSEQERRHAPAVQAGFRGSLFDQLDSYVEGGDRVYYQVPHRPYGTLDLHDTVASLGRHYLAPAIEVTDPADATVVVSYHADPSLIDLNWVLQRQLGPGIYVSRAYYP